MNGFRNWFGRYMMGRYGSDELNRFLLIVAAILILVGMFVHRHILNVLVVILLILVYCRMFSRNIGKRQQENMKYLQTKSRVTGGRGGGSTGGYNGYNGYNGQNNYGSQSGYGGYGSSGSGGSNRGSRFRRKQKPAPGKRIFICPQCKGSLQVPVGAGRIRIKCPHCGSEFEETV